MTALTIYSEEQAVEFATTDYAVISQQLNALGVQFERWEANCAFSADADQATVLAAYQQPVERLMNEFGFRSVDVISVNPNHPDKTALRQKFLAEHIHEDFEVRFFVEGCGLFYLHVADKVYAVLCEQGDLISVPAHTTHWFDMGENPEFKCIRLFTTPEGWLAQFTGNLMAEKFPTLEQFQAGLA